MTTIHHTHHSKGDNVKSKITASPRKSGARHVTFLQQPQYITYPNSFKEVEGITIFEWLSEKRNCPGFCREFTLVLFSITIWCSTLIAFGVKAVDFFLEENDRNALPNGIAMMIIALSMAAILLLWFIIFSSLWKGLNLMIRLNNYYLNAIHDNNTAFAV